MATSIPTPREIIKNMQKLENEDVQNLRSLVQEAMADLNRLIVIDGWLEIFIDIPSGFSIPVIYRIAAEIRESGWRVEIESSQKEGYYYRLRYQVPSYGPV